MIPTEELATAIAAVKRATPMDDPWTGYDISRDDQCANTVEHAIATILNAVVSGDLAEVISLRAEVARRTAEGLTMARNITFLEGDLHKAEARATAAEADAERLAEALVEAAVPLEGLTLAANMSKSNMGLCKGTWDEINNAVSHIREAISAHPQRVNAKEGPK